MQQVVYQSRLVSLLYVNVIMTFLKASHICAKIKIIRFYMCAQTIKELMNFITKFNNLDAVFILMTS